MPRIGKLQLDAPFFQAGLAGYSDTAMRLIARRHGAPFCVTEAMLDQFLITGGKGLAAAELDRTDHPIAGQLMGSHPRDMAQGAAILCRLGYDVIDVNLACPVKKVRKKARGGHLMSQPEDAIALLDAVRQAVPAEVPCLVKLRRGTDESATALNDFRRILEAAITLGFDGAIVHGRTVTQKYIGPSQWDFLAQMVRDYAPPDTGLKDKAPFLLGGSGDVWTAADIFRMIQQTGVSLVSVARGCIGNPWIFTQARAFIAGDGEALHRPPTIAQQRQVLLDHFDLALTRHGEHRAGMTMRKFGIRFARHHPEGATIARAFIAVKNLADWDAVVQRFYQGDGPGVVLPPAEMTPAAGLEGCDSPPMFEQDEPLPQEAAAGV